MAGVRRTWDKDFYAQKARERLEYGDDYVDDKEGVPKVKKILKEEFKPAQEDELSKAFIKPREQKLELDEKVGKMEVINPLAEDGAKAGFWCEVCKCLMKDSASYLDHINGKKRNYNFLIFFRFLFNSFLLDQRALGYSMRVERADVEAVKERLAMLKRKMLNAGQEPAQRPSALEEVDKKIAEETELRELRKKRKIEEQQAKKSEITPMEGDDELQAVLGFNGFKSKKK